MRKFLNAIILIPLGVIFVVIIAVAILGVAAGGLATWFSQHRWRRAARQHEADARDLRSQLADLRASTAASQRRDLSLPAVPSQGAAYRRDKQGATL